DFPKPSKPHHNVTIRCTLYHSFNSVWLNIWQMPLLFIVKDVFYISQKSSRSYSYCFSFLLWNMSLLAIFFKHAAQVVGNHLGRSAFDMVSFYKMHQLAVFK